ncbi:MAG TPA: hypothetical protein P5038_17710, partial [Candidatus Paceibacterota bacterium]|nr:hypothetical protein [Candidatus Paceibacterota bacterium]
MPRDNPPPGFEGTLEVKVAEADPPPLEPAFRSGGSRRGQAKHRVRGAARHGGGRKVGIIGG